MKKRLLKIIRELKTLPTKKASDKINLGKKKIEIDQAENIKHE